MAAATPQQAVSDRTTRPSRVAGHPIIGSTRDFTRDPLAFIMRTTAQGDVVQFRLASRTFYLENHPDGVKYVIAQ